MFHLFSNTSHHGTGGTVKCDEVDFGLVCQMHSTPAPGEAIFCYETLNIDCGNQNSIEGTIFSPNFPENVTNDYFFGKVLQFLKFNSSKLNFKYIFHAVPTDNL